MRRGCAPRLRGGRRAARARASPSVQFQRMSSKIVVASKAGDSEALARLLQGGKKLC